MADKNTSNINLNDVVSGDVSVSDAIAIAKQKLSEKVAHNILSLFKISTVSMLAVIMFLSAIDAYFIYSGTITPANRLITSEVVMAVIGATIVQVGAASAAIVYSLFKSPKNKDIVEDE